MKHQKLFWILFLMTFVVLGVSVSLLSRQNAESEPPVSDTQLQTAPESLVISADECLLSPGQQLLLAAEMTPASSSPITWSSSDESVVTVSPDGMMTAAGNGEAEITASCGGCAGTVSVTVDGDLRSDTLYAVRQLADSCGSGTAYVNAQLLREQLQRLDSDEAKALFELLDSILAYSSGSGSRDRLEAAILDSTLSSRICRTAAAACCAKHEMLSCEAVISFAGDVTMARYNETNTSDRFPKVYAASGSKTYPFDRVRGIFTCDAMTVVNFEGALTGSKKHLNKTFYFRGDPLYAAILPACSVEAATLANNHSGDYLDAGFSDTVKYLGNAGVKTFWQDAPLEADVNGGSGKLRVVMIGAVCIGDNIPKSLLDGVLAQIRRFKTSDTVVIVNFHWGVEGRDTPEKCQQDAAHAMIDAGADLVVGHHPHVLQGVECYNGRYIAYSLGNFCFGGNASANSPETVILRAMIGRTGGGLSVTGVSAVPCHTTSDSSRNNYQPCICFGSSGQDVIDLLLKRSAALEYGIKDISRSGI